MKINYELDEQYVEEEEMLAFLILQGDVFINNGWWYKEEGKPWIEDSVTLHVNCNDIFAWGCADSEDLKYSEIRELYEMVKKDKNLGAAAFCIKKRKMRPQPPVEKMFKDAGIWNLQELINEQT